MECISTSLQSLVELKKINAYNYDNYMQLLTVMASLIQPMEQWAHPLEPPSWWLLPTPVTLDTTLLDQTLGLVGPLHCGLQMPPPVHVSNMNDCVRCIHCVHISQLLTVVPSLFLLTGKSVHPLEPSSWTQPPTPVMLDTLSMEHQIEPVKLMEPGA